MPSRLTLAIRQFLADCTKPKTVTGAELERLKAKWYEPTTSTWHYVGSKDGFHWFRHDDSGAHPRGFRVSEAELPWQDTFPVTRERSSWRRLDW